MSRRSYVPINVERSDLTPRIQSKPCKLNAYFWCKVILCFYILCIRLRPSVLHSTTRNNTISMGLKNRCEKVVEIPGGSQFIQFHLFWIITTKDSRILFLTLADGKIERKSSKFESISSRKGRGRSKLQTRYLMGARSLYWLSTYKDF